MPGSWINANFNVWIGAPEDNKAWDYLYHARNFYAQAAPGATEQQRQLAFEEILIAEGSDWNWWYGPEHHSANDRDFDELYRKHLSNVYQALGGIPPDYLAQPITGAVARPSFTPQTAYIHPRFAAIWCATSSGWVRRVTRPTNARASMHGKQFLMDEVFAGIDEHYVYGRLDFAGQVPEDAFEMVVNLESWANHSSKPRRELRLDVAVDGGRMQSWKMTEGKDKVVAVLRFFDSDRSRCAGCAGRNFEFRLPLAWLPAAPLGIDKVRGPKSSDVLTVRLRLRSVLWQNHLPVDALPVEGWIELELLAEEDLLAVGG